VIILNGHRRKRKNNDIHPLSPGPSALGTSLFIYCGEQIPNLIYKGKKKKKKKKKKKILNK